mgnify:CR=1 FL=1
MRDTRPDKWPNSISDEWTVCGAINDTNRVAFRLTLSFADQCTKCLADCSSFSIVATRAWYPRRMSGETAAGASSKSSSRKRSSAPYLSIALSSARDFAAAAVRSSACAGSSCAVVAT